MEMVPTLVDVLSSVALIPDLSNVARCQRWVVYYACARQELPAVVLLHREDLEACLAYHYSEDFRGPRSSWTTLSVV